MREYLMAEYSSARARISADIDEINKSEIFYITFVGVTYAAIFQFDIRNAYALGFLCSIALIASIYGWVRYEAHRKIIQIHEKFIKEIIEKEFMKETSGEGLASFYDRNKNSVLKYARRLLHAILVVFTFAILKLVMFFPDFAVSVVSGRAA